MKRGKLVVFEGADGTGKTTLAKAVIAKWPGPVALYREPGSTELSEAVRNLLMLHRDSLHPSAALCLFFAARCELFDKHIKPDLARGINVILDRYWLSTFVYQIWPMFTGMFADISTVMDKTVDLVEFLNLPTPDLWVVCTTGPSVVLERLKAKDDFNPLDSLDPCVVADLLHRYDTAVDLLIEDRVMVVGTDQPLEKSVKQVMTMVDYMAKESEQA